MCGLLYIMKSGASPLSFDCLLHCELNLVISLVVQQLADAHICALLNLCLHCK